MKKLAPLLLSLAASCVEPPPEKDMSVELAEETVNLIQSMKFPRSCRELIAEVLKRTDKFEPQATGNLNEAVLADGETRITVVIAGMGEKLRAVLLAIDKMPKGDEFPVETEAGQMNGFIGTFCIDDE